MNGANTGYPAHVKTLRERYDIALERSGYDAVVIAAGHPHAIFLDDQHLPFKANPHLLQWGPLHEHPGSVLLVTQGETPQLLVYMPTDFWHRVPPVPALFSDSAINVQPVKDSHVIAEAVAKLSGAVAFIGEMRQPAHDTLPDATGFGLKDCNPKPLVSLMNEFRTVKTAWEINNMREASRVGARGHQAAKEAFFGGASEYEIHLAFRTACDVTDAEMPYPAIVALNDHAATLHYQRLERKRNDNHSLLIDAGHAVNGYASDITRTYSTDAEFDTLIAAMHDLQRQLCEAALPGVDYKALHHSAHLAIAGLLHEFGVLQASPEDAIEAGVSGTFFPHGLGHFLGLQVHDVGALYARREPGTAVPEGEDKHLRLTRTLVPGNVLTIEPGIYFIDSLLQALRKKPEADMIDWGRVEKLKAFGGIRIEDNLLITETSHDNLTREAFSTLGQ